MTVMYVTLVQNAFQPLDEALNPLLSEVLFISSLELCPTH